jgi:site-specific DNA-methyltransferase (adenine-specific)
VVLDPFMGTGTTLVAAALEGVKGIGIDLDPAYVEIAARRLAEIDTTP